MDSWPFILPSAAKSINSTLVGTILDRLDGSKSNSTEPISFKQILPSVLDFFLPGYGLLSNVILGHLGLDISLVLNVCLGLFVLMQLRKAILKALSPVLARCVTEFTFDGSGVLYSVFQKWARERNIGLGQRSVQVDVDKEQDYYVTDSLKDFDPLSSTTIHTPPRRLQITPSWGRHWFWHNYRLFCFTHHKETKQDKEDEITASLSCISLTTQPLQALCMDILADAHQKNISKTKIWWPESSEMRRRGWNRAWKCLVVRESRPIHTVILDKTLKGKILLDVAEFLRKDTSRWYSQRGLPYRRGYLFSGAPGTGKTSLSFAMAGMFRLPIYILPLQDPSITENDLMLLFNELPEKCIIILEDIDSAGLKNRGSMVKTDTASRTNTRKKANAEIDDESKISLSGLLNVIDGIASTEGRILIMTTNNVEALDPALTRPGRVDLTIDFELLTRDDASELFKLMYQGSLSGIDQKDAKHLDLALLDRLAPQFASRIPEKTFSPAEVQGYLLTRKDRPKDAVEGIQDWVVKTLEKKKLEEQRRKELEEQKAKEAAEQIEKDDSTEANPDGQQDDGKKEKKQSANTEVKAKKA